MEDTFFINVSSVLPKNIQQEHISVLLSRLIAQKKKPYIESKIHALNAKYFNFKFKKKIFLKYNTSNWGSCSHSGCDCLAVSRSAIGSSEATKCKSVRAYEAAGRDGLC